MSDFSLIGQSANLTGQQDGINIVGGTLPSLFFSDIDNLLAIPLVGETVSVDGGPAQTYSFLGTGNVRNDTSQPAAFIQTADGEVYAIDLSPDVNGQPDLPNGNTQLTVSELDEGSTQPFPVPPVPCFVAGTLIETDKGPRPVESILTGDQVLCADRGYRTVRWAGSRRIDAGFLSANGRCTPVKFAVGSLGRGLPRRDLWVSPQHRMLIRSWQAEMMFGDSEVLVAAKHLVDGNGITWPECREDVIYVHLLFDQHQIIFAEGTETESFNPGLMNIDAFSRETRAEILSLFPALLEETMSDGPGLAARRVLNAHEGRCLWHRIGRGDAL